jgi:2-dehydro-3-deoxygluconokinase
MLGVNTSFIQRSGHRLGIYYLEHGSGPRPSKVIYDRKGSSVSQISPDDVDWEEVLKDAQWFNWTGITPALGDSVEKCLRRGLKEAQRLGVKVSVDLNYRKKLWKEEDANTVMTELMKYTDIMIGNEEDSTSVFGIKPSGSDVCKGELNVEGYNQMMKTLYERFDLEKVAVTLRESLSATENNWSACLYNGRDFLVGSKYKIWITDRVGTGDAFAAGLIFSLLKEEKDRQALEFGIASSVFKHTVYGDFNIASAEEIRKLTQKEIHGRVQR